MRFGPLLATVVLAGCASLPPGAPPAASAPAFDPIAFFSGHTQGNGRIRIAVRRSVALHVDGWGSVGRDGSLHLVQTVIEGNKPPVHRDWRVARSPDGAWRGTLSDARGPVLVTASGNRLRIRFAMAHGLAAEQWLVLEPGGQATRNRLIVRKFGIMIARVDERIVRLP